MGVAATEVEYRCCSRWAFVCSANNDASEFSSRTVRFYRLELHKRTSGGRQAAGNIGCKYEHKFLTLVVHVRGDWRCAFGSLARHVPARVLSM